MLTRETLRHLWPKAPQSKIDAICSICDDVFAEFGIDDPKVVAQLMANISHENGAGTIVRESGNYKPDRICEIFGAPHSSAAVSASEAQSLAHNGPALFERVYNVPKSPKLAKTLGNCAPGDGYRFRGGGDLQLTGRANYERIGKLTGHPEIVENPDLLADPEISFRVAVAEFVALKCVSPAKRGQTAVVRRLVNGGSNGLAEVTVWVRKWEEALPGVEAPLPAPRAADSTNKSLSSSKIIQGAAGAAASLGTAAASKVAEHANTTTSTVNINDVADKLQQASDVVTTISTAKDNISVIVTAAKPFLGLASDTWAIIAGCAIVVAAVFVGFVLWERYKKLRDQGV